MQQPLSLLPAHQAKLKSNYSYVKTLCEDFILLSCMEHGGCLQSAGLD